MQKFQLQKIATKMEKRLANSVESEDEDELFEESGIPTLAHFTLLNAEVLAKLFSFLTPTELKVARKVCRAWRNEATTFLGKRSFLNLSKFLLQQWVSEEVLPSSENADQIKSKLSVSVFEDENKINTKLVRRIKIVDDSGRTRGCAVTPSLQQILNFVSNYAKQIQDVKFHVGDSFTSLPTMSALLEHPWLPNLKKIFIFEEISPNSGLGNYTLNPEQFPNMCTLPSVEVLEFSCGLTGGQCTAGLASAYLPIVAHLIPKLPNLKKLRIGENFYPNLNPGKRIQSLEWKEHPFMPHRDFDAILDYREITEVNLVHLPLFKNLDHVQNTKQLLVLVGELRDRKTNKLLFWSELEQMGTAFPNLEHLTLYLHSPFKFTDLISTLYINHFQSLQSLELITQTGSLEAAGVPLYDFYSLLEYPKITFINFKGSDWRLVKYMEQKGRQSNTIEFIKRVGHSLVWTMMKDGLTFTETTRLTVLENHLKSHPEYWHGVSSENGSSAGFIRDFYQTEPKFVCPDKSCEVLSSNPHELKIHVKRSHPTLEWNFQQPLPCQICSLYNIFQAPQRLM